MENGSFPKNKPAHSIQLPMVNHVAHASSNLSFWSRRSKMRKNPPEPIILFIVAQFGDGGVAIDRLSLIYLSLFFYP